MITPLAVIRRFMPELGTEANAAEISRRLAAKVQRPPVGSLPTQLTGYDVAASDPNLALLFLSLAEGISPRLPNAVASHSCVADVAEVTRGIRATMAARLADQLLRTLVTVLADRRADGLLDGTTPAERFDDFRRWLASGAGLRHLQREHPEAVSLALHRARSCERTALETLSWLANDLPLPVLGIGPGVRIVAFEPGQGDTHAGGRSVTMCTFDDGSRLVVKPRPMAIEAAYNRFLGTLVQAGIVSLPTLDVVDRGDHGYTRFVHAEQNGMTHRFARGLGELTSVLYVLGASDMHFENLTVVGGLPLVIDAETLLRAPLAHDGHHAPDAGSHIAERVISESVLGIGVLPHIVTGGASGDSLDIGAIGYRAGQLSPFLGLKVVDAGLDTMRLRLERLPLEAANVNPALGGEGPPPSAVQQDVLEGVATAFERLTAAAPAVRVHLAAGFTGVSARWVASPTVFYAQLLRMATHPDALAEPLARASILYRVALRPDALESGLADDEWRQLDQGDIPSFRYPVDGLDLRSADGHLVAADHFATSGLAAALARLDDLDRQAVTQVRLAGLAFVSRLGTDAEGTVLVGDAVEESRGLPERTLEPDQLVEWAGRLARELADEAVLSRSPHHPSTWIGPQVTTADQSQWTPGPLGYDLYGGSPGIALTLAGAGLACGDSRVMDVAAGVLGPIAAQLVNGTLDGLPVSSGGMTGLSGTAWAVHVAQERFGLRLGVSPLALLRAIEAHRAAGSADFVAGTSGALAAALAIAGSVSADQAAPPLAAILATHLDNLAREGWLAGSTLVDGTPTGYAHGVAGVLPSLRLAAERLADHDAVDVYLRLRAALNSELATSAPPRTVGRPESAYAWCHGAPGLLLAHLQLDGPSTSPSTAALIEATRRRGVGNNITYCHGDLSSLEILRSAASATRNQALATWERGAYARLARTDLSAYGRRRRNKYDHALSLMAGKAGAIWSLLRASAPDSYPSVLTLGLPEVAQTP